MAHSVSVGGLVHFPATKTRFDSASATSRRVPANEAHPRIQVWTPSFEGGINRNKQLRDFSLSTLADHFSTEKEGVSCQSLIRELALILRTAKATG